MRGLLTLTLTFTLTASAQAFLFGPKGDSNAQLALFVDISIASEMPLVGVQPR